MIMTPLERLEQACYDSLEVIEEMATQEPEYEGFWDDFKNAVKHTLACLEQLK